MKIYHKLLEAEENYYSKKRFSKDIDKLKEAIDVYLSEEDDEERSDLLGTILLHLESINSEMNKMGVTYTPDVSADEDEDTFQEILQRYIESAYDFLKSETNEDIESFNAQTRYVTSLVDLHRTQYVKEGEILLDPET